MLLNMYFTDYFYMYEYRTKYVFHWLFFLQLNVAYVLCSTRDLYYWFIVPYNALINYKLMMHTNCFNFVAPTIWILIRVVGSNEVCVLSLFTNLKKKKKSEAY